MTGPDVRFRVALVRELDGQTVELRPLYTEAATAFEAGQKVTGSHVRPSRSRVVAVTAICDATGRVGVWTL